MTIEGATSTAVFRTFVDEHLAPTLGDGDVMAIDNQGAHHATGIREAIEATGAKIVHMPPDSPDLNPIELCWSKIEQSLCRTGARTVATLKNAVHIASEEVGAFDTAGWFSHCGYSHQPV